MAGFIYYLPGPWAPSREHLAALGFPHAHEAGAHGPSPGPDGGRGHVFTLKATTVPGARAAEPAFDPKSIDPEATDPKQVWHACAESAWWLGWNVDDQPRPVDLARSVPLSGTDMTLSDGSIWRVPRIRGTDGAPAVGCVLDIRPDGRLVVDQPAPQYRRLWDAVITALSQAKQGVNIFTDEQTIRLVCDVMAWNYRVSIWELLKLGCLTTENFAPVFAAITGLVE